MEKLLIYLGFVKSRQKGSHVSYKHPDGRTTTVPHHPGRVLSITLVRKIMRDIELSVEEYKKALKENGASGYCVERGIRSRPPK